MEGVPWLVYSTHIFHVLTSWVETLIRVRGNSGTSYMANRTNSARPHLPSLPPYPSIPTYIKIIIVATVPAPEWTPITALLHLHLVLAALSTQSNHYFRLGARPRGNLDATASRSTAAALKIIILPKLHHHLFGLVRYTVISIERIFW